ncbi:hypothetical protein GUJ93_ZPchr0012g21402 [Zizania palustris]|uniref:Uncharacterized protein n=1 Tax=Zizania palustris TaxID=103762 RepID=A0A8J5WH57_ZIZPA|nr:hypothetical protein GUJ93_ZPchr0012g21402 [Zizania palustris]
MATGISLSALPPVTRRAYIHHASCPDLTPHPSCSPMAPKSGHWVVLRLSISPSKSILTSPEWMLEDFRIMAGGLNGQSVEDGYPQCSRYIWRP